MARAYQIRAGNAFVLDGHRMHGGERIVLEDDVAAMHADKIDPIDAGEDKAAKTPKAAKAPKGKAAAPAAEGDANGHGDA